MHCSTKYFAVKHNYKQNHFKQENNPPVFINLALAKTGDFFPSNYDKEIGT